MCPISDDLGPQPDPEIEPGEPAPGGPDSVEFTDGTPDGDAPPLVADLAPEDNPSAPGLPEEMKETEDTSTEATRDEGGEPDTDGERESPV